MKILLKTYFIVIYKKHLVKLILNNYKKYDLILNVKRIPLTLRNNNHNNNKMMKLEINKIVFNKIKNRL